MNSQPINLEEVEKDPLLHKVVRQSFRIPITDSENFWVRIGETQYPIQDVCMDGIGITLEDPSNFTISQVFMDCEIGIKNEIISGLNGRVIHFSLNAGKDWQCGIQWINISKEAEQKLADVVSNLKKEFLTEDDQTD